MREQKKINWNTNNVGNDRILTTEIYCIYSLSLSLFCLLHPSPSSCRFICTTLYGDIASKKKSFYCFNFYMQQHASAMQIWHRKINFIICIDDDKSQLNWKMGNIFFFTLVCAHVALYFCLGLMFTFPLVTSRFKIEYKREKKNIKIYQLKF